MKLDAGLHRIGNDIVASYLIVTPEGITLIDAGLSGHWKELLRELELIGRSVGDVRGVILTHGDSDHLGFAERLRREYAVPVYVHEADAERARGGKKPATGRERMRLGAVVRFASYALGKGGARTHWLREVESVRPGDRLDLPGAPELISVPGHSPGSLAIFSAPVSAVFVGDALTTRNVLTGEVGPQPAPFTVDRALASASLDAIAATGARWVLPGHGAPWGDGASAAVAAARSSVDPEA